MATNKELYDESSRKTYNNIDSNEQLMYVEVTKNKFAGYRQEMLVYSLSEIETDFYVCTECKGVMRNACQTGEEQNPVCEVCVEEGVPSQSMVKSRNKILELQARCPLATRGCNWNGKMVQVEEHLITCEKFVVNCTNACNVILPKSELNLHLKSFCEKRPVTCKYCIQYFMYKELINHHLTCLEYQFPCPNNCNMNLKQKRLDSHLDLECPNMVVECPYKKYGCGKEVFRCELEEHKKTNQIQHLESKSIFADREMEELKQTNKQLTEMNMHLTKRNNQITETNKQLTGRVITLGNEVDMSSYPIILCDEISIPLFNINSPFLVIRKVHWRRKISVGFEHIKNNKFISVSVRMENENTKAPPAKWPFQGRFKLTVIGKKYKSYIYESRLTKLQPENVLKHKGRYASEFVIAEIMFEHFQGDSIFSDRRIKFILQIQEI